LADAQFARGQLGSIELFRVMKECLVAAVLHCADDFKGSLLDDRIEKAGGSDELVQFGGEGGIRVSDQIHRAGR
jgi:hypothetical protein